MTAQPPDDNTDLGLFDNDDTHVEPTEQRVNGQHGHQIDGPLKRLIDDNFLQYASYVIRDRAIPKLEDGLKPVQRRILWSLKQNDDGKFIKVANIVGHTMQFHPHGDASIADALVALTNKTYLIEGQGNFGNIFTGDPAAASRYIECRLTELARAELFHDELTKCIPSYDGRNKEPVTLPAKLPVLLMLGAEGIAVGLSTKVLPHNFKELLEAQVAILQKKAFTLFPDFFQGGCMDVAEYDNGNGKVKVRAVIEQKTDNRLIIKEIPFGTTTESVISSIEDAARKKKIQIRSINDYTAEHIEIEIKLTSEAKPEKTIQALYAFTQCEVSISSRIIVIHKNRPVEMNVPEVLNFNTRQLVKLLKRELLLEQKKLQDELHRKTLIQIFIENRIYKQIEECRTYPDVIQAVTNGMNRFRERLKRDITQSDVEMLLSIQIKRISRFDISKNRKEIGDILDGLVQVEKNLAELVPYAIRYLRRLLKKYGNSYERRTKITTFKQVEVRELTASELAINWDRENHYIGTAVKAEPEFTCSSLDKILLVWADGRYRVVPPPDKLFVDHTLIHLALPERKKVYTVIYSEGLITYIKRFTFGGFITNREYLCIPPDSEILFFSDQDPKQLFVKYKRAKNQKIHEQIFETQKQSVKSVKARGVQMTVKQIASIATVRPKGWPIKKAAPKGAVIDF